MDGAEDIFENLESVDFVLENWLIRVFYLESRKRVGKNMLNDSVADVLIRIKNGYLVGKLEIEAPYSKLVFNVCDLLSKEGFVEKVSQDGKAVKVALKYEGRKSAISDVKRVSKPGLRVYKGSKALPRVLNGLGIAIISTPKGLMTDKQARKAKLGGEVMALIW